MRLIAVVDSIGNTQGTAHSGLRAAHRAGFRDVLASFALPREKLLAIIYEANRLGVRVFLDSGAFSAFTRGLRIDIAEYVEFCLSTRTLLEDIACLDVIGDDVATQRNYEAMRKAGLEPLATYHFGMDPRELVARLQDVDRAALGGMASRETRVNAKRRAWLDPVFHELMRSPRWKRSPIRLHGYGLTDGELMGRYPWFSVDSTSWWVKASYGFEYADGMTLTPSSSSVLVRKGPSSKTARTYKNAATMVRHAEYLTRLWMARGVRFE